MNATVLKRVVTQLLPVSVPLIEIKYIGAENSLFVAGLCVYSYRDDRGE